MKQVAQLKMTGNVAGVLQISQKIPENYCPCLYQLAKFGDLMSYGSKDMLKNAS